MEQGLDLKCRRYRVNVKYRYVYEDVDRHGNVRIYFWRGIGHRKIRLNEKVGSPEFHRYLVTEYGAAFTPPGFGGWFREQCDKAGLKHCSAHGLRKAGASIAAENGASAHQLMAIFGWLTLKEAERYTQAARRRRMARDGMGFLVRRETNDEQNFPTSGSGDFPTD